MSLPIVAQSGPYLSAGNEENGLIQANWMPKRKSWLQWSICIWSRICHWKCSSNNSHESFALSILVVASCPLPPSQIPRWDPIWAPKFDAKKKAEDFVEKVCHTATTEMLASPGVDIFVPSLMGENKRASGWVDHPRSEMRQSLVVIEIGSISRIMPKFVVIEWTISQGLQFLFWIPPKICWDS